MSPESQAYQDVWMRVRAAIKSKIPDASDADLDDAACMVVHAALRAFQAERVTIAANILGIADALDVGPHDKHSAKSCSDLMRGIAHELSTSSKK